MLKKVGPRMDPRGTLERNAKELEKEITKNVINLLEITKFS